MRRGLVLMTLLLMAIVASAMAVVYARHESRSLFIELEKAEAERDELNYEWGRLQIEQSAWSTHGRIEEVAHGKLNMVMPDRSNTVVIDE